MIIQNNLKVIETLQKIKNFTKYNFVNEKEKENDLKTLQNELKNDNTYKNYIKNLTNDYIYNNKQVFVLDEPSKKASKKELSTRLYNLASENNLTIKTTKKSLLLTSKAKKDIIITIKNILQINSDDEKDLLIKLNKNNACKSDDIISNNMIKNALISCIQNKMINGEDYDKNNQYRLYGTCINVNKFMQAITANIYSLYMNNNVTCSDNYKKVMQVLKTIDEALEKEANAVQETSEANAVQETSEKNAEEEEA